jgi:hypothetical protein
MLRRGAVRLPRNSDCHPAKKSTSQQAPPVYPTEGWTCTRSRPNLRIIVTHNLPFRPPSMGCADRKCNQPGSWSAASPPQAISAFHSSPTWANANHPRYDCIALRHPSDLTDEGVTPDPAGQGGDKRTPDEREVVNGLVRLTIPAMERRYNSDTRAMKYCVMYSMAIRT